MSQNEYYYAAGTFKCQPRISAQFYVLDYFKNGHVLLGCSALIKHKNSLSNDILFSARDNLPEARQAGSRNFNLDFEIGAVVAFMQAFPVAEEYYGSFPHLTISIQESH